MIFTGLSLKCNNEVRKILKFVLPLSITILRLSLVR